MISDGEFLIILQALASTTQIKNLGWIHRIHEWVIKFTRLGAVVQIDRIVKGVTVRT